MRKHQLADLASNELNNTIGGLILTVCLIAESAITEFIAGYCYIQKQNLK